MKALRAFIRDIKPEHTLFALPFAYAGALLAQGALPSLRTLGWITLAVLGARTAAMAANRLIDAKGLETSTLAPIRSWSGRSSLASPR